MTDERGLRFNETASTALYVLLRSADSMDRPDQLRRGGPTSATQTDPQVTNNADLRGKGLPAFQRRDRAFTALSESLPLSFPLDQKS